MEENQTKSKKVLWVEDTVSLRDALDLYLRQAGLEVITAVDGEEGYMRSEEAHPDFVLTDIFMPRLGGIDMAKKIRTTEWGKAVPILLLSNFSLDKETLETVKKMGRLKYMTKSDSSLKEVVATVQDMIQRYEGLEGDIDEVEEDGKKEDPDSDIWERDKQDVRGWRGVK